MKVLPKSVTSQSNSEPTSVILHPLQGSLGRNFGVSHTFQPRVELSFRSFMDVVEEAHDCFRYVAETRGLS